MAMGGDLIKEYLVGLGFQVDEKGLNNFNKAMATAKKSAFGIVGVVAAATTGIMKFLGDMNEKEKKLEADAKKMRSKNIEDARAYSNALEAIGATAEQIKKDKTLQALHKEFMEMGKAMALPEGAAGLKNVDNMIMAFKRLKLTGTYAMDWLNYQIKTVAGRQIDFITGALNRANKLFQANLPMITEWVAIGVKTILKFVTNIIRIGEIVLDVLSRIPAPILKIAGAIIGLWALIRAGPMGWIAAAITIINLLLDDLFTHLEGGDALLGGFWDACIKWIGKIVEAFQKLKEPIENIKKWFTELYDKIKENVDFAEAWENIKGIFSAIGEILATIVGYIIDITTAAFGFADSSETLTSIGNILQDVIVAALEIIVQSIETFRGVLDSIVLLLQGDFEGAWNKLKETGIATWNGIKDALQPLIDSITTALQPALESINGYLASVRDESGNIDWSALASKIISDIETAFSTYAGKAGSFIKKLVLGDAGEDADWSDVGEKIKTDIESAFSKAGQFLKGLILGTERAEDANWSDVGEKIKADIEGAFSDAGGFLKGLILGNEATEDASWSDVGEAIIEGIKSAFNGAGNFLKTLILGEDGAEADWSDVGSSIIDGIKSAFSDASNFLITLILGDEGSEADWSDIGNAIIDGIKAAFSAAGSFLKDLIMGGEGEAASWSDVGETIWEGIKSGFTGVSEWLKSLFTGGDVAEGDASNWSQIGKGILAKITESFGNISIEDIGTGLASFAGKIGEGIANAFEWTADMASTLVEKIQLGFAGVSGGGGEGALSFVTEAAKAIIQPILDKITEEGFISGLLETAGNVLEMIINGILSGAVSKIEGAEKIITQIMNAILTSEFAGDVQTSAGEIFNKIVEAIVSAAEAAGDVGASLITAIFDLIAGVDIKDLGDGLKNVAIAIIDGIVEGLKSGVDVAGKLLGAISEGFSKLNDADIGEEIGGMLSGFAESLLTSLTNGLEGADFSGLIQKLGEGIRGAMEFLGDIAGSLVSWILSAEGLTTIFNAGKTIITELFNGIVSMAAELGHGVMNIVGTILEGAVKGILSWFGVSPEDLIDPMFMAIYTAFDEAGNVVEKSGEELNNILTDTTADIGERIDAYFALSAAGIAGGIEEYFPEIYIAGEALAKQFSEGIISDPADMEKAATFLVSELGEKARDVLQNDELFDIGVAQLPFLDAQNYDEQLVAFVREMGEKYGMTFEDILQSFSGGMDWTLGTEEAVGQLEEELSNLSLDPDVNVDPNYTIDSDAGTEGLEEAIEEQLGDTTVKTDANIEADTEGAEQAAEETKEAFTSELETLPDEMEPIGQEAGEKLAEGFESASDSIVDAAKEIPNAIVEEFLLNMSADQGTQIAAQFGEGIVQGLQDAYEKIQEIWKPFPEWLQKIFEDARNKAISALRPMIAQARSIADQVKSAFDDIPSHIASVFEQAASSVSGALSQMASEAASVAAEIKSSFDSIASAAASASSGASSSGGGGGGKGAATQTRNAAGGVYDSPRDTKIAEEGREYIIPVNRPNNAIPLLRAAMADLGITPESFQNANAMLGGSASMNMTPAYAQPFQASGGGQASYYNETNNTPVNINIQGNNPTSIGNAAARAVERMWVRNRRRPVK